MEENNLIVIKQLPIIEEQLRKVSDEIDIKVKNAVDLVCNEETVKAVKEIRANLNKELKEFEDKRKQVKSEVLKPYEDFETSYKKYISDKYKSADIELKNKIDSVESELKAKKEQEIKDYFEEYRQANKIDFISYEKARINVTLSASMKSLKEQVKSFIDKIADDLKLIDTQEHKAEILVEYKQSLNVSNAITTVSNRFKAIEEEKAKQEREEKLQKEIVEIAKEGDKCENSAPTIEEEQNPFAITRKKTTIKFELTEQEYNRLTEYLDSSFIKYEVVL